MDADAQHRRAGGLAHRGAAVHPQLTDRAQRAGVLLAAAPLAAVALAVFADGGYGDASRVAFGVTALVAGGLAVASGRARLREPLVLLLLGLAAAGALSALWTLGPADRTLRWALVTAGYAAVVLAAGAAVRRERGVEALAGGLAVLAVAVGGAGLVATAAHVRSYALPIAGVWRPAGPFEYPPALALLMVSALPALLAGMAARSRALAACAAVGMTVAGGVLALAGSRTGLAMGLVVAGAALAWPRATVGAARARIAAALALGAVAGIALALSPALLVGVVPIAALAWPPVRSVLERRGTSPSREIRTLPALLVASAVAVLVGTLAFGAAAGRGSGPPSDFLHGRTDTWRAAVETFADRPLTGAGADAFLAGSARHQDGASIVFAHSLPLELAAELGVAGLVLAIALYALSGRALWRARGTPALWLLGPAATAFLIANLLDWPWHLAGSGGVWALAAGAIAVSARQEQVRTPQ